MSIKTFIFSVSLLLLSLACRAGEDSLKVYPIGGDFTLKDQEGRPFTLSEYRKAHPGDPVLLFFGFTRCPDVCPQTMSRLSRATALLGDDRQRVLTLLVTVDPAHDTPAVLKEYLGRYPLHSLGLSGSRSEIEKVAALYAVNFYERGSKQGGGKTPDAHAAHAGHQSRGDHTGHDAHQDHAEHNAPTGGGLINHSPQTFLIDGKGQVRYLFRTDDPLKKIAETIEILL